MVVRLKRGSAELKDKIYLVPEFVPFGTISNRDKLVYDPDDLKGMNTFKESLESLLINIINLEEIIKKIAEFAPTKTKKALRLLKGTIFPRRPTRKIVREIHSLYMAVIENLNNFRDGHQSHVANMQPRPPSIPYNDLFKEWIGSGKSNMDVLFNTIIGTLSYSREGIVYSALKEKRSEDAVLGIERVLTFLNGINVTLKRSLVNANKIIKDEERRRDGLFVQLNKDEQEVKNKERR